MRATILKSIFSALFAINLAAYEASASITIASYEIDRSWTRSFMSSAESFTYSFGSGFAPNYMFYNNWLHNGQPRTVLTATRSNFTYFDNFVETITNGKVDRLWRYTKYSGGSGGGSSAPESSIFDYYQERYSGRDFGDFLIESVQFTVEKVEIKYSSSQRSTSYYLKGRLELIGTPKPYPSYPVEYNLKALTDATDSSSDGWIPTDSISYGVNDGKFSLYRSNLPSKYYLIQFSEDLSSWKDVDAYSASENEFSAEFQTSDLTNCFFRVLEKTP